MGGDVAAMTCIRWSPPVVTDPSFTEQAEVVACGAAVVAVGSPPIARVAAAISPIALNLLVISERLL
ncbi:hypothetical protein GCM10009554_83820 [Kribbella koreensis]|uniref:Uncharacterized protein n=2 Tax=Kribbella TaxID=182639 RepID=A0ABP6Z226_9ACTN